MKNTYLTTKDNPWNPFTNWEEWLRFDILKGYNTCEKIDRLSTMSDVLPETINLEILEETMNELVTLGTYDKEGNFMEYIKFTNNETNNTK